MLYLRGMLFVLLAGCLTSGAVELKGTRPNIIFVMTDDQGNNLSCMGQTKVHTPHIDTFAKQSMRFNNYYVSPELCAESCGDHERCA